MPPSCKKPVRNRKSPDGLQFKHADEGSRRVYSFHGLVEIRKPELVVAESRTNFLRALRGFVIQPFRFMSADLVQLVTDIARRARAASLVLATASTGQKNAALARLADLLPASTDALLAANARDLAAA